MSENWYEVWANEGHRVPYLLLVRPFKDGFEVLDPVSANRQAYWSKDYEDVKMWLLEDEFVRVGRNDLDEYL